MRGLLAGLLVWVLAVGSAAAGPLIVEDGVARATIVTAEQPSESASRAAAELQHFVRLMSGAELPVVTADAAEGLPEGRARLLVGRSRLLKGVAVPSGEDRLHTREGFVLKTDGRDVILAGNEDAGYRGTEYAVYELLERLGCRWYFPGEFGQVVPVMRTIRVPDLDLREKPAFVVRNIWMSGWAAGVEGYETWLIRNKGTSAEAFAFAGDGTIYALAPPEKYADQYPDIYAMGPDGVRQGKGTPHHLLMLETENPKTVEIGARTIRDYFREHPEANSFGFSAPDGLPQSYSPEAVAANHEFARLCGTRDSISDGYFDFVNNVMHLVTPEFADRYLVVMAYSNRMRPPEGLDRPWNKNIIPKIAYLNYSAIRPIGSKNDIFALRYERLLRGWSRITPRILIYDYDPHSDLSRMPYWRSHAIASDMRTYRKHGVIGFTTEAHASYFRTGLNYYVRARLMWDPDTDVDALLKDYHKRFFGRAAGPMAEFTRRVERMLQDSPRHMMWMGAALDWSPIYPPDQVEKLGRLLDRAEARAEPDEVRGRIRLYRILHGYMTTYLQAFSLLNEGRFAQALEEARKLDGYIEAAQRIQPGLLPPLPEWVLQRGLGQAYIERYFASLAALAGGEAGRLLGLAPRVGGFRPDPDNVGLFEQWQRPDVARQLDWAEIPIIWGWELSRGRWGRLLPSGGRRDLFPPAVAPYDGLGWYWLTIKLAHPQGQERAILHVPRIYAEKVWIWLNGHLVYSPADLEPPAESAQKLTLQGTEVSLPRPQRPVRLDMGGPVLIDRARALLVDVTDHARFGEENTLVLRVKGRKSHVYHGLVGRPLVWQPKR